MDSRAVAILVTLVVYKIVLIVIGVICSGRTRDGVDFFLGGRRLGPVVAAGNDRIDAARFQPQRRRVHGESAGGVQ